MGLLGEGQRRERKKKEKEKKEDKKKEKKRKPKRLSKVGRPYVYYNDILTFTR
ncbi:hypothetical protein BCR43DRAFT_500115 [Syncephalastrum racemosum]|uniref:Uncharacterized protein n=1 Tax=Syncephalastrum racemosum TaxID=13706 RepID=A0A1X2GZ05_SYNRA|nr:hypothetical protein BCR43DRAFT_500115 [Syncephalastrum racemosum]